MPPNSERKGKELIYFVLIPGEVIHENIKDNSSI